MDYDTRQSNFGNRQPPNVRRYRRKAAAATVGGNKLLGNNRFRNLTKIISSPTKGSILDKMDAVSILKKTCFRLIPIKIMQQKMAKLGNNRHLNSQHI